MRVGTCLNERLLLAVIRAPPPLSNHLCRPQNVQTWVRAITTTRPRPEGASVLSFGEENDAILEKYMQPLKKNPRTKTTKQKSGGAEISHASPPAEDFEISDFVDRSAPKPQPQSAVEAHPQDSSKVASPKTQPKNEPSPGIKRHSEPWQVQKGALKIKFPEGWKPRKKLSPDAMEGIRGLHEQDPDKYSTAVLAEQFKVSPEAIRRILKSKWMLKQSPEMMQQRRERWAKRHDRIWDAKAELGLRPKRRKDKEVEDPEKFERDMQRREILGEI